MSFAAEPLRGGFVFFPRIPDGWSDVDVEFTISMPGFLLSEGRAEQLGYAGVSYSPSALNEKFPNIDVRFPEDPRIPILSDEVFVSIFVSGVDAAGEKVHAAKHITLVGEDIYNLN